MSAGPAGALERLAAHSASGFPHLLAARARTAAALEELRARIADVPRDADASIVMLGSWGRRELTGPSDNDWLLLVDGALRADVRGIDALRTVFRAAGREPGAQGVFGTVAFVPTLTGEIGLEGDLNRNLTQRMLLMLESVPVAGDDVHERAWERILDGYLSDAPKGFRPPRFFLNDLVRYWRTIAVDYVGKERQGGEGWALRNAKLRTSRKALFASGLLPLLLCHEQPRATLRPFLAEQLRAPATDRIAWAFLHLGAADEGARALEAYDRWLGMLEREDVRRELATLPREEAGESALFRDVRRLARQLEAGLLSLLFESSRDLAVTVRDYVVF